MRFRNIILLILICAVVSFSQTRKDSMDYPLSFNLVWGGATPEWTNLFDWNVVPFGSADTVRYKAAQALAVTAGTRNKKYYSTTCDFNQGEMLVQMGLIDTAWALHTADGQPVIMVGTSRYFVDITNYCPQISRAPYSGRRYNEMQADTIAYLANAGLCDGINSDGTWGYPYPIDGVPFTTIDLDRNGVADYGEHGGGTINGTRAWFAHAWAEGYNALFGRLRAKSGWSDRLITYWTVPADIWADTMAIHTANGVGWENAPQNQPITYDIPYDGERTYGKPVLKLWEDATPAPTPRMNFLTTSMWKDQATSACPTPYIPNAARWWRYMRWTLAMSAQSKAFYCLQLWDGDCGSLDHSFNLRYDEFNAKIGQPSTPDTVYSIRSGEVTIKFFAKGCVIRYSPLDNANTTSSLTVDTNDIKGLAGYAGPYHRLYGNQDTLTNTGLVFTSVTLTATPSGRSQGSGQGWMQRYGDAIILKTTTDTTMEPVIVDNAVSGTIPGSDTARIIGTASYNAADHSQNNPYWNTGGYPPGSSTSWQYYCQKRLGSSVTDSAKFTPKLNRAGYWRLYEWHGHVMSGTEVNNVPCRIWYSGGYKDTTINQTANYGQWNLMGRYPYTPTSNQHTAIAGTGSGTPIVDAWMWIYETSGSAPEEPPVEQPPSTDKKIFLRGD
jgi:hypothetical protein